MKLLNEKIMVIVQGMIDGDRNAYNEFVRIYSPVIYRECLNFCGDNDEANDHLNEILIRIVIAIGSYDPEKGGIYAWIKKISGNYLRNCYKKQQEEPDFVFCRDDALDLFESPQIHVLSVKTDDEEDVEAPAVTGLRKALSVLSLRDRSILFYRAEGFSYESIGEFLRIKAGTAMTAYSRAVKIIRGIMMNAGGIQG